jgi:hypothetical protein
MGLYLSAKKMPLLILLPLLFLGGDRPGASFLDMQATRVLDWKTVEKAYGGFVNCPSQENAKALLAALPQDKTDKMIGNAEHALGLIFSSENFPILYGEAIAGERTSVEIYFRLLNVSDGFGLELVLSTLGDIARNYPHLFLEILSQYQDIESIKTQGLPVSFVGGGYDVHPRAAIYIQEKRIEALENVNDPKYKKIRDACVRDLRAAIKIRANKEESESSF